MDDQEKIIALILIVMIIIISTTLSWTVAESVTENRIANDICISLTYDMGVYEDGQVVCSYKSDVPLDELAPIPD